MIIVKFWYNISSGYMDFMCYIYHGPEVYIMLYINLAIRKYLKKILPEGRRPKGNIFFNTSELPGLYNAYRTMDHGIYDIS